MCGICGYIDRQKATVNSTVIARMTDTLVHRGPDDRGEWVDQEAGVALGHRRLSVIDLSETGKQPMHSSCGRYVLTFNGEIYNHRELRSDLEDAGSVFRGTSDTEILLEAIRVWGLSETLRRSVGMFAFALWDRYDRTLTLARDRFGEKPLYYGFQKETFLFSSELRALRKHPAWEGVIDRKALGRYMFYMYVPTPMSIYRGIYKVPPGTYLTVSEATMNDGVSPQAVVYWSLEEHGLNPLNPPFRGTADEAAGWIESLLRTSIAGQMIADVPIGAFLSGGIDSSTVVALMQSQSAARVKTFTIGFDSALHDEAVSARAVAKHLGTDHTELCLSGERTISTLSDMASIYDEPFGDSSQVPTYLVSCLARRAVIVALSGDGGDELFGGYNRYFSTERVWKSLRRWPKWSRRLVGNGIRCVSPALWNRIYFFLESVVPSSLRRRLPGEYIHKLATLLPAENDRELYGRLLSQWHSPSELVLSAESSVAISPTHEKIQSFTTSMMYHDATNYLPDDILVKVDRASMAVSLEARLPLLDHRIAEAAFSLPLHMKIANGVGKLVLRRILRKHVPDVLINRPKSGFSVPIAKWLRGPLRPWAEAMLNEDLLRQQGYLNPAPIRRAWQRHLSGRQDHHHRLWCVLMFQAWLSKHH